MQRRRRSLSSVLVTFPLPLRWKVWGGVCVCMYVSTYVYVCVLCGHCKQWERQGLEDEDGCCIPEVQGDEEENNDLTINLKQSVVQRPTFYFLYTQTLRFRFRLKRSERQIWTG